MNYCVHVNCQTVVEAGYSMNEYSGYSGQPGSGIMFPGQPFISSAVADVASQYGRQVPDYVHKNVSTAAHLCVLVKHLEISFALW